LKIAIVTDKSRMNLIPREEALKEDEQKRKTVEEIERILSQKYECISLVADDTEKPISACPDKTAVITLSAP